MKTIEIQDGSPLKEVLAQNGDQEVVVLQNGRAVALVVPFDDDDLEWYARERDASFIDSIATARQQVASGQTTGHAELRQRLGLA